MYSKDELERRRTALSSSKRALLANHLRGQASTDTIYTVPAPTIPCRPANAAVPLSLSQQHFWFLQQLDPASTSYVHTHVHVLDYVLDHAVLTTALRALVARHDILSTTYQVQDGQIVQCVDPQFLDTVTIPLHDLQAMPEAERAPAARRLIDQDRDRPVRRRRHPRRD